MNTTEFKMLCSEIEAIASQVFNDEKEPCDFSEDETFFDAENYSELWEDRS